MTTTSSPRLRPSSALPTGDSFESLSSAGLASAVPTIAYRVDLPASSLTWTTEPTRTTSVLRSEASTIVAERSLSSSAAIRASSIACAFLASSYSAFSEMSPNSRASLIRPATSRRPVVESWSSSALRLVSPSWVRMTSLGIALKPVVGVVDQPSGLSDRAIAVTAITRSVSGRVFSQPNPPASCSSARSSIDTAQTASSRTRH